MFDDPTRPTRFNRDPYTFLNVSSVPPHILTVIHGILKSWDMAVTDYSYVKQFHPTGSLHVLQEPSIGYEAMRQLHVMMIDPERGPVINLQHYLDRFFLMPNQPEGKTEIIFTGLLTSVLKTGEEVTTDFATYIIMSPSAEHGGDLKVELLRVFSDTSVLMAKIGEIMAQGGAKN